MVGVCWVCKHCYLFVVVFVALLCLWFLKGFSSLFFGIVFGGFGGLGEGGRVVSSSQTTKRRFDTLNRLLFLFLAFFLFLCGVLIVAPFYGEFLI